MEEHGWVVMMAKGKVICIGLWKDENANKTAQQGVHTLPRTQEFDFGGQKLNGTFYNTHTGGILRLDNGGYTYNSWTFFGGRGGVLRTVLAPIIEEHIKPGLTDVCGSSFLVYVSRLLVPSSSSSALSLSVSWLPSVSTSPPRSRSSSGIGESRREVNSIRKMVVAPRLQIHGSEVISIATRNDRGLTISLKGARYSFIQG